MLRSPTANEFSLMQALIQTDRFPERERENRVYAAYLHDRLADGTEIVYAWFGRWVPYQIGR